MLTQNLPHNKITEQGILSDYNVQAKFTKNTYASNLLSSNVIVSFYDFLYHKIMFIYKHDLTTIVEHEIEYSENKIVAYL